jgi:DNA-binding NtrC family response regulator
MTNRTSVLVVEDDDAMRSALEDELRDAGCNVVAVSDGADALYRLEHDEIDVVVTDLRMPGMQGDELLARIRYRDPEVPVVIITAFGSIDSAVSAMKSGAFHYVSKPFHLADLLRTLDGAVRQRRLRYALTRYQERATGDTLRRVIAESPSMRRTMDLVVRAAESDAPVLLVGESGTGKELLARELHSGSPRRSGPFLAVNCSAIPDTLLESHLFGHRRGAFTDARQDRNGLFRDAKGGTILLDEIGDMPPLLQSKLLRVLQEKEVHPLGAPAPVSVDVRVVAATHRDLEAMIEENRFRLDLYYRLKVIVVNVPPLRERPGDLVPLVAHFLNKHGRRLGREHSISAGALALLSGYHWPGNVRELENTIERCLALSKSDVIDVADLPGDFRPIARVVSGPSSVRSMAEIEREHIQRALRVAGGNKSAAARLLGVDRKTLYSKMKLYSLPLRANPDPASPQL